MKTFVEVLRERAALGGGKTAYTFLADGESASGSWTYAELAAQARAYASMLQAAGVGRGRILLLLPPGLDFVAAFYGCALAACVAVPAYPPQSRRMFARLRAIFADAEPAAVLTTAAILGRARSRFQAEIDTASIPWLTVESVGAAPADAWRDPALEPHEIALLQYTSGSTSAPKGVMVSHANLLHNQRLIQRACAHDESSRFVSWLPPYHDLGLIGNLLQSAFVGGSCTLMAPVAFLQRPRRWLEAVSRYGATTSGGPDFAFDLCVRRIPPAEREGLDLGGWEVAFNGAEPVRPLTLERFAAAFAGCGFRAAAFYPCYGLAEATLMVAGGGGERPVIGRFDAAALERGEIVPVPAAKQADGDDEVNDPPPRRLVGCGRPLPGQEVRIVDPASCGVAADGRQGEIWIRGESVALGYWRQPQASAEAFGARLAGSGEGPYLRTGDLGFLHGGELYVSGRIKDLIIVRGRNLHPQDLELAVRESHPSLAAGSGAAFTVEEGEAEQLVVVHEVELRPGLAPEEVSAAARSAVAAAFEVSLHRLLLIRHGTLPRTSSGKVQRHACRRQMLAGELAVVADSSVVEAERETAALLLSRAAVLELEPDQRRPVLEEAIRRLTAAALRLQIPELAADQPLSTVGLDSLAALELSLELESRFGLAWSPGDLLERGTLRACVDDIEAGLGSPANVREPLRRDPDLADEGPGALSIGQEGLWFLCRLDQDSPAYNAFGALSPRSPLAVEPLAYACRAVIRRHPALRTRFGERDGVPHQEVQPYGAAELRLLPLAANDPREMRRRLAEEALRPFDLARGPLFRALLFVSPDGGRQALLFVVHHLVCDFWSLALVLDEIGQVYRERTAGTPAQLPPAGVRYRDYVQHQRRGMADAAVQDSLTYWQEQLAGDPPPLDLPCDRRAAAAPEGAALHAGRRLGGTASAGLRAAAAAHRATPFMFTLAAFEALLQRYCGQDDLLIGVPTAGRPARALDGVVGYFVNPLPLRANLAGNPTGTELLARVTAAACGALSHPHLPYSLLVHRLRQSGEERRAPLFRAAFVFYRPPAASSPLPVALALGLAAPVASWAGGEAEPVALDVLPAPFELTLAAGIVEDDLALSIQGRRDLFDLSTLERMGRHLETLLAGLAAAPHRHLSDLAFLSAAERHQLLVDWSQAANPAGERSAAGAEEQAEQVVEQVARQAAARPAAVALAWGGEEMTYGELERRANRLARHLVRRGVGPERRVALLLERSPELVVAALAVLKTGAAYLPLDPPHPAERLAGMIADAAAAWVLTRGEQAVALARDAAAAALAAATAGRLLDLDALAAEIAAESPRPAPRPWRADLPESLAYVIYTSGSTGVPKGVGVPHRGLSNLVAWHRAAHSLDERCRATLVAGVGFDASVWEIWSALACGAALHIAPAEAIGAPDRLATWLAERRITHTFLPTPLAEALLAEPLAAGLGLQVLLTGGDRLHRGPLPGRPFALANHYGPTESSVVATWALLDDDDGADRDGEGDPTPLPPIGRPIDGTRVFVVDAEHRPVPAGVAGELWIGGGGLARGYLGQPALTAERFIPDPFGAVPGERLYRSGDRVRWLAAGQLDFLGRIDRQVKVRGFRIEVEEIEAQLLALPGVRAAAVVLRADPTDPADPADPWRAAGTEGLAAYWVATGEPAVDAAGLRQALARRLPKPMLPRWLIELPRLPLTPHGKVDRRALPAPPHAPAVATAPRTPLEEIVAATWCQVLNRDRIGAEEDFFALGGHSLLATQVASRLAQALGVEIPLRTLFEHTTVAALAAALAPRLRHAGAAPPAASSPIPRLPRGDGVLPLSFAQERMWFIHQLDPASAAYNIPVSLRLRGPLEAAALAAALDAIVRRHEALRACFVVVEGAPRQRISPPAPFALPRLDLGALPRHRATAEGRRLLGAHAGQTFDLARGALLRAALLVLAPAEHWLLLNLHHIAGDGWSMGVLAREITELYAAARDRRPSRLADLPLQYADFAAWQRQWLSGEALDSQLQFWRDHLAGAPQRLAIPADRPRLARPAGAGAGLNLCLEPALAAALRRLSRNAGASLFMTLSAAFRALLWRLTGQADLVVGSPVANRGRREIEPLIGLFVNMLAIRTRLDGSRPWSDLLASVREEALAAYAHGELPFERLVEELQPVRSLSHAPLVQVVLSLQSRVLEPPALAGLTVDLLDLLNSTAKFDLSLSLFDERDEIACWYEYRSDLFDRSTILRLAGHLHVLLQDLAALPARPLADLSILTAAERHQLLGAWSAAAADPGDTTAGVAEQVVEQVARQAAARPAAVALAWGGEEMTYGELERRANRLARHLVRRGVGPERRVALLLERSPELVVAALAVLKTGAAHRPLDPHQRAERRAGLIAPAAAAWVLTDGEQAVALARDAAAAALAAATAGRLLDLDALAADIAAESPRPAPRPWRADLPESLAYVIYTSGSTGVPKGVGVPHRGLSNLVAWHRAAHSLDERCRATLVAGVGFDASVWEIWSALACGAALHIAPAEAIGAPDRLATWLAERRITHTFLPTPLAEALLAEPLAAGLGLQVLLTGGDRLHRGPLPGRPFALANHYGPTESSVVATWALLDDDDGADRAGAGDPPPRPPSGRPIDGTRVFVVDAEHRPVPAGVAGELWIGGGGLARGYLGQPALTAERFIPDPFGAVPGERLYRSGDRVRWLAAGQLDFLGRIDRQVKVRGFRIEVEEIEAQLLALPGVRAAAVVLRADPTDPADPADPWGAAGTEGLAAYWVATGEPGVVAAGMRQALARRLPKPMLPRWLIELPRLPLTPHGKVDRRALPAPPHAPAVATAPRTPLEEIVAGTWCQVLGRERIGAEEEFFALGGHSLLATQVASRLTRALGVEVPLRTLFEHTTVAALAAAIEEIDRGGRHGGAAPAAVAPPIPRLPRGADALPLSFAQERMWFIHQLEPASAAYGMASAHRARGPLCPAALARAFGALVRRHETLRTVFLPGKRGPEQRIAAAGRPFLRRIDLAALPAPARRRELARLIDEDGDLPFDLARGPLLRTALVALEAEEHVLLLNLHHIAGDGWSMGVFARELAALYEAGRRGEACVLPELPIQYADFAAWQRRWLDGARREEEIAFWRDRLAGAPPVLALPTDRPRPPAQSFRGASRPLDLPPGVEAALRAFCHREGVTPLMVLLGVFATLLARWTGDGDLCLGLPIAGRNRLETEGLIGFFVNTLVVRCDLAGDPAFGALLARLRREVLAAYAHQDLPFEILVEALQPERSLSYEPIFQAVIDFHNRLPEIASHPSGLDWRPIPLEQKAVHFDLILTAEERETLDGRLEYRTDLFDASTIQRLAAHFRILLAAALADPRPALSELPLLSPWERQQALAEPSGDRAAFPVAGLHHLFEEQARRRPAHPAVVCSLDELSYRDLDRRANHLAHHLVRLGVGPEVIVGICLERSLNLVIAMLAVLKAGGAYLPLDPAYPAERLAFMLRESGAALVLTAAAPAAALPATSVRLLRLDDLALEGADDRPAANGFQPGNLAYVIFTSGSTGKPRGVLVSHANASRLLGATAAWFGCGPDDVWSLFHSFAFDFSVWEIWGALAYGGRLVVVPYWTSRQAETFHQLLVQEGVTVLSQTPSAFRQLIAADERAAPESRRGLALRWVIFGGEALDLASLRPWIERHGADKPALVNMYGITETTVHVTYRRLAESDIRAAAGSVIGRALPDLTLRVLGPTSQPQPIGAPGELCVGGAGLTRGYLGQPARTAEKFVPDPFGDEAGARLYRSGDLGRRLANGDLQYLGRIDHQVKIRGFRIELGEIEAVLSAHPEVKECVVVARQDAAGEPQLVAYAAGGAADAGPARLAGLPSLARLARLDAAMLRQHLKKSLPDYMVPAACVILDALPLTASGKVDRAALPPPDGQPAAAGDAYVPPGGPIEEIVVEIWREVLNLERIGVREDFFALGGHSLLATQVVSRLREVLHLDLPVRRLFEAPTAAELARVIETQLAAAAGRDDIPLAAGSGGRRLPAGIAQRRLWFIEQLDPTAIPFNLPVAVELGGALDVARFAASVSAIVGRQEALRTTFEESAGELFQVVGLSFRAAVPVVDLAALPAGGRRREADRLTVAEARRAMPLAGGPLFRVLLLHLAAGEHRALLTFHHMIADGWSLGVLLRELAAFYRAATLRTAAELPPLAVQYRDYLEWQCRWLASAACQAEADHWRRQLAGASPALDLPTDRTRPATPTFRGGQREIVVRAAALTELRRLGRGESCTLFITILAAFAALLRRLSGQDEVIIGAPIAGRGQRGCEDLVGLFLNTLALRIGGAQQPSFRQLMTHARETALDAYAHQLLPFEHVIEAVQPARDLGRSPIFQVMLVLQNAPLGIAALDGLRMTPVDLDVGIARLDLTLVGAERENGLLLALQYSTDLFDGATASRMMSSLGRLLDAVPAEADGAVALLPLMSAAERHQVEIEWLPPACAEPALDLYALFAAWAARDPAATAISRDGEQLTYGELAARSEALAAALAADGGEPGGPVAILGGTGTPTLVAMLATLAAGRAFVGLDPDHPPARLRAVLDLAGAEVVVAETAGLADHREWLHAWEAETGRRVVITTGGRAAATAAGGAWRRPRIDLAATAYVVFTSGSTGTPKGIVYSQRSFVQFLSWQAERFAIGPGCRIAHWASTTYDASYCEILGALCFGATLCTTTKSVRLDASRLLGWLGAERVSLLQVVPSFFRHLLEQARAPGGTAPLASVRWLLLVGEVLPPDLAAAGWAVLPAGCRMFNLYGPTESVLASWFELSPGERQGEAVPIGRPIHGREIWLADGAGQPCPIGVRGEIRMRSRYLATGYLDEAARRAAFVPCTLRGGGGGVGYRTGDFGRWLPDGTLRFDGRIDAQVKLHGVRIELEDVEQAIARHPEVVECAAAVRTVAGGDQQLIAWYIPRSVRSDGGDGGAAALAAALLDLARRSLPTAYVPSAFLALPALPRTRTNKLDRAALARLDAGELRPRREYRAPSTPTEQGMAQLWQELLKTEKVGAGDNFFAIGGHSLLATRLLNRVRSDFGAELPLRALFEAPVLADLAARVDAVRRQQDGLDQRIADLLAQVGALSPHEVAALLRERGHAGAGGGASAAAGQPEVSLR